MHDRKLRIVHTYFARMALSFAVATVICTPAQSQTNFEVWKKIQQSKPINISTLAELYSGKTWEWPNGGAYYSPDGSYIAFIDRPENTSYAIGSWYTSILGKLCIRSRWIGNWKGPYNIVTRCYQHREHNNNIYSKGRSGWFKLKSNNFAHKDYYDRSFKEGNTINDIFEKTKFKVDEAQLLNE